MNDRDKKLAALFTRYFGRTFSAIKNEVRASREGNPADKDGDRQPDASCFYVNSLVMDMRKSQDGGAFLAALISAGGDLEDAKEHMDHLVFHNMLEAGMALQRLIDRGEIDPAALYPPGWDSYQGELDHDEALRILVDEVGEENDDASPKVEITLGQSEFGSMDDLFNAMESLMQEVNDDEEGSVGDESDPSDG